MAHEMTISPGVAANFCEAVYGIMNRDDVGVGFSARRPGHGLGGDWNLGAGTAIRGSSGHITPKRTGFAAVVPGSSNRPQETVVAVRGTQGTFAISPDWQSNAAMASSFAPVGGLVHRGFHSVCNTIASGVLEQLSALPSEQRNVIHVTGHSLGGAVASLLAARVHKAGLGSVKLYTFGAPRPGMKAFTSGLNSALKAKNIYRVYNMQDIVPMVPLYPYLHPPHKQDGIRVGQSAAAISAVEQHVMTTGYIPKVDGNGWDTLIAGSSEVKSLRRVDYWLERASAAVRIPGGSFGLWALGKALQAIIDMAVDVLGIALFAAATVIDMLAMLIEKAWRLTSEISGRILKLLKSILTWAGKKVLGPIAEVTGTFLRYVLGLMLRPMISLAQRAFDAVDRLS